MQYDLIIIGAGVAAASALITLKNSGLKIAVIAPKQRPEFKIGETLGPAGSVELQQLRVSPLINASDHWPSFQKFSSWGTPQLLPSHSGTHQSWYLDRIKFEQTLWEKARNTGFDHYDMKATHADSQANSWNVQTTESELQAKVVLDASGRSSAIGRNHFRRTRHDKLLALYSVLHQSDEEVEPTRATMIEARSAGWFYSVLIPGNRMVVSWFTDSDLLPKGHQEQQQYFLSEVNESHYTLQRIQTAGFQTNKDIKITDASTLTTDAFSKNNLILAGDAAVCFDPLSSHGITTALWSGRKSALAIQSLMKKDQTPLSRYSESFRKGTLNYLKEKQEIYLMEQRFRTEVFWRRRNGQS